MNNGIQTSQLVFAVIGGGTLTAVGAGLYKLGSTIGDLTRAVKGFDERLHEVEQALESCPGPQATKLHR